MALSLSSASLVYECIAGAKDVAFGTYVLRPDGPALHALLDAAHNGAHVVVTLQRDPYNIENGKAFNADSARALRRAGARVRLLELAETAFHLKAATCDGVAYFDDRNWTAAGREIVIADNKPRDAAQVRAALTGRSASSDRTAALRRDVALRKDDALARETSLIRRAGDAPVIVESEYVAASPLADALCDHAERGARTILILAGWRHHPRGEFALLQRLTRAGVDVRETGNNEKLALVGNRAWIGSANATGAYDERTARQADWGVVTSVKTLVNAVRAALWRDGARDAIESPR